MPRIHWVAPKLPTSGLLLVYFHQNKKRRKPKVKIVTLQLCEVKKSQYSFYEKVPTCAAQANRRGEQTREGARSGVTRLDHMKRGSGIKDRDDRSRGIEILIADALVKINPTDPLILAKQATRRNLNCSDSSGPVSHQSEPRIHGGRAEKKRKKSMSSPVKECFRSVLLKPVEFVGKDTTRKATHGSPSRIYRDMLPW